jgi:cell division protein FtsQ
MAKTLSKSRRASDKVQNRQPLDWSKVGRWSLALLLFSIIGIGGVWLVETLRDPRVLPFKVVRIDGQLRHLDRLQIEKVVGGEIRGNFFTLDVERVYRAAQDLPWIDQVSVRRVWPETLVMKISEQIPMARWGEHQLVNLQGDVFSPLQHEIPEGLPHLYGPSGSSRELVARYLELKPRLTLVGLELNQLILDARHSWKLVFADGMRLHLGSKEMEARLQRFISIFPRIQVAAETDSRLLDVDLRYTNGFTVRRQLKQTTPDSDSRKPVIGKQSVHAGGQV